MFEHSKRLNDDVMLNKLYNMIKTSLSLNNVDNKRELLINFEKVAKDIDKKEHISYLNEVNEKFYKTTNLDDERKRLSSLIVCITSRVEQRNRLLDDYSSVTGQTLFNLDDIIYEDELASFKDRANTICNYLENEEEISNIKKELEFLANQLEKERDVKRNCEVVNAKLEEKLLNNFKNVIAGNKYYTSLAIKDIDEEINKNEKEIVEKEEKVNAFVLAYDSIKNESITSNEQLEEYSSYVSQMKEMFYDCAKKKAFLQIYKLVMDPKVATEEIYHKRITIKNLLDELTATKMKLKIEEPNLLFDFYMLVKEQDVKVINSVDNMKKIKQIEDKIDYFNDKINKLEKEQENEKIVEILKEYGLIKVEEVIEDNYYNNEFNNSNDFYNFDNNHLDDLLDNFKDEKVELNNKIEEIKPIEYKSNAIKEVKDLPFSMNIGLVKKKAYNVINKVSNRLGIVRQEVNNKEVKDEIKLDIPVKVEEVLENNNLTNNIQDDVLKFTEPFGDKVDEYNIEDNNINEQSQEESVKMPNFDFTTFWDEITVNNKNSDNGDNMPNLPI